MAEKVTILFLTANPVLSARLRTGADVREVTEAVRSSLDRGRYDVVSLPAARSGDLQRALRQYRPQIVHFSGHGSDEGIVLEDDSGSERPLSGDALAALFQIMAGTIRLVVLSACESLTTAEAFRSFVDYTIAMKRKIPDGAAIAFNKAFYAALADGEPIPRAFDFGAAALKEEFREDADVPQLLRRAGVSDGAVVPKTRKDGVKKKPRPWPRKMRDLIIIDGHHIKVR